MHVGTFREKTCEIYNDQVDKAFDLKTIIDKGILNVRTNDLLIYAFFFSRSFVVVHKYWAGGEMRSVWYAIAQHECRRVLRTIQRNFIRQKQMGD